MYTYMTKCLQLSPISKMIPIRGFDRAVPNVA